MSSRNFILYARKSTDDADHQVRSIDDQLSELRELARREDVAIVDIMIEKQSAKTPGRPVFNQMLARLEAGEALGILAWHPDRLARNSLDGGRIIYLVDAGVIEELKFPTFWFEPTPQGKFMLSIIFGQSKYYGDNLSEKIKRGHRQRAKSGIIPQKAPVGYMNDPTTRTVVQDPERASLVRRCFEEYASGNYTLDEIVKLGKKFGLTTRKGELLARSQYHRILQNPTYYGMIVFNGELYEGKHDLIISKRLFDEVQRVIAKLRKNRKLPRLKPYRYRGIFECGECRCSVTTQTNKGHNYLRCTKKGKPCSQKCIREEWIDRQVSDLLAALSLPESFADDVAEELKQLAQGESADNTVRATELRAKVASISLRLERLMDHLLDGTVDQDEYRQAKAQLLAGKKTTEEHLAKLTTGGSEWSKPALAFLEACKSNAFLASSHDFAKKVEMLKEVGSNLAIENRTLRLIPREAWQLVAGQGSFAHTFTAAALAAAANVGETHLSELKRRASDLNSLQTSNSTALQTCTLHLNRSVRR